jgi:hypothetical protein
MKTNEMTTVRQLTAWAWKAASLITALIAIASAPATALGADTNATQVERSDLSATDLVATFDFYDESGWVLANVFLGASVGQGCDTVSGCFTSVMVTATISVMDFWQGWQLMQATGLIEEQGLVNGAKVYQVDDHDLSSGWVVATIRMYDFITALNFDLDVNLRWTATDHRFTDVIASHVDDSGTLLNRRADGTCRVASASGSITCVPPWGDPANVWNFAPVPSTYAQIDMGHIDTITVERSK